MRPRQILALVSGLALAIPAGALLTTPVEAATAAAAPRGRGGRAGARPDARRRAEQEDAVGARRRGHQDRPGRQHDDRGRPVHAGGRPDERDAVHAAEPVRLRRDHRPGEPDLQPDRRRPGPAAAARPDPGHRLRRGRLHQDQQQGPEPHPAAQRDHRSGGDVVQGAVDQRRHRDDRAAAQQPAVHRRLLHQDRRCQPRPDGHPQRHDRCPRPVREHHRVRPPQQQRLGRPGARSASASPP